MIYRSIDDLIRANIRSTVICSTRLLFYIVLLKLMSGRHIGSPTVGKLPTNCGSPYHPGQEYVRVIATIGDGHHIGGNKNSV